MIRIGVVGVGYWGPNLVRNLAQVPDAQVVAICDLNLKKAGDIAAKFSPQAKITADPQELARDPQIDCVVIATPIRTHFELGRLFLDSGKHVMIEKPLASSAAQCEQLIELADQRGVYLMVGHVFEFSAPVRKIKTYLKGGELGRLFYIHSQRLNLGRIQHDINCLWSFAPHDISILNYWLGDEPVRVGARGMSFLNQGIEDVAFVQLEYPGGVQAHLHLGWLDPRKVRQMTLVGSKKMLVYDDVHSDLRIQIYDKGVNQVEDFLHAPGSFAEFKFQIRTGDVTVPHLPFDEPLQTECQHFIECIRGSKPPSTDGRSGLRVVQVLEAAERSMREGGRMVEIAEGVK